jgi:hypothetical protein
MKEGFLNECCKALGWQGGTIHEVVNVLKHVKKLQTIYFSEKQMGIEENMDKLLKMI